MKSTVLILSLLGGAALGEAVDLPKFRHVTIDDKVRIGYGIAIADMNADKKPDVILCDARNIAWYQNCLLYTSPSPRDKRQSRMPSSA